MFNPAMRVSHSISSLIVLKLNLSAYCRVVPCGKIITTPTSHCPFEGPFTYIFQELGGFSSDDWVMSSIRG